MSAAYMSRTRNPLLVKDDVGRAKPSCYKLPPEDFSYGRPDMPDYEGAREVSSGGLHKLSSVTAAARLKSNAKSQIVFFKLNEHRHKIK